MAIHSTPIKPKVDAKGLFADTVFALALGTAPFDTKSALRKKITSNGGVISYLVTAKCDFLITCDKSSSSTLTSEKAATKYGIPVVTPDFVDACLSTGTILAVEQQQSGEGGELREKLEQEFTKGNVLVGETDTSVKNRRGNYTSKLKAWEFLDPNGPKFHQREHDVAKFCCLQGRTLSTGETQFCVLEIHVLTRPQDEENEFRFCVYQHLDSGRNNFPENKNKKSTSSTGSTQRLCRFTDSSTEALQAFEKLHDMLSSPPHSMSKWNLQTPLPPHLGSPHFRSARERWVAVLGQLETPLVELLERVWEAAVGRMDRLLLRPIRPSAAQLDSCEALLLEIRRQLTRNDGESVRRLTEDYFQQLPQHEQRPLDSGKELVRQQELLQLIRDVVAVSEPVVALQQQQEEEEEDDGHMSTAAKYRALNCSVSHLAASSVEYEAVLERVLKAGAGEASPVRIRNVFALRRPDEEVVFDHKLDNRQILFHASPVSNFVGILSRGLLLPKVIGEEKGSDVLGPGDLGAGIYFSDSPAASLRYCGESGGEGGPRLMLLAQVALGNTLTVGAAGMPQLTAAPDGHDSVRRFARDGQLPGAEYAIFRTEQQRLIYLIELEPEAADVPAPIRKKRPVEKSNDVIKMDVSSTHSNRSVIRDVLEELLAEKDRLNAVAWGLRAAGNKELPVASVHVRVEITDLAAKVVIMQEYSNPSDVTLQAKYVFPLDELSAVCGFEAFINGKHVVGVVREKEVARREFSQAVSQGHGAYLMDEIDKDTFSVSVGNLPPRAKVLIKITYVTELTTEGEKILFRLPGFSARQQHVAPERSHFRRTSDLTEEEEEVVAPGGSESIATYSFQAAVTMPFAIRAITSHTHSILLKKTETMATVRLGAGQQLARELRILIELAEIHVPRMWVERTDGLPEACMLTFFPSFDGGQVDSGTLTVVLDASDSMRGDAFRDAQSLAMLCLHFLSGDWNFNVVLFGSTYDELFPVPRIKSQENLVLAESFVSEAVASLGCTDANQVLRPFYLLPGPHATQNVLLISDGHLNNPGALLSLMSRDLQQTNYSGTRLFTMGVGAESSPCNRHLLRLLAERGSGACEYFDATARWNWAGKVRDQMLRCAQASLSDVKVEWQQLDEGEGGKTAVQAPARLAPMFRGTRQVVYGFVPHCSLATLSGRIGSQRVSTVVSCAELSKSQGRTLHLLTARAVIRDWEAGLLVEDAARNAARKTASEELIVSLSKQYGLVSSLTSFVAVEKRDQNKDLLFGPKIIDLVLAETIDHLRYMKYSDLSHMDKLVDSCYNRKKILTAKYGCSQMSSRLLRLRREYLKDSPTTLNEIEPSDPPQCSVTAQSEFKLIDTAATLDRFTSRLPMVASQSCSTNRPRSLEAVTAKGGFHAPHQNISKLSPAVRFQSAGIPGKSFQAPAASTSVALSSQYARVVGNVKCSISSKAPPAPLSSATDARSTLPAMASSSAESLQAIDDLIDNLFDYTGIAGSETLPPIAAYTSFEKCVTLGDSDDLSYSTETFSFAAPCSDDLLSNDVVHTLCASLSRVPPVSAATNIPSSLCDYTYPTASLGSARSSLASSTYGASRTLHSFDTVANDMTTTINASLDSDDDMGFGLFEGDDEVPPSPTVELLFDCQKKKKKIKKSPARCVNFTKLSSPTFYDREISEVAENVEAFSVASVDEPRFGDGSSYQSCCKTCDRPLDDVGANDVADNNPNDTKGPETTPDGNQDRFFMMKHADGAGIFRLRRYCGTCFRPVEEEDANQNALAMASLMWPPTVDTTNTDFAQYSMCATLVDCLLHPSSELLPHDIKALLNKGIYENQKAIDLLQMMNRLTVAADSGRTESFATQKYRWLNVIFDRQSQVCSFSQDINTWVGGTWATSHLLRTLEEAGIKSLGVMQFMIAQLCLTMFILLRIWFRIFPRGLLDKDNHSKMESTLKMFTSSQLLTLIKCLIFVRWAENQAPLSCRLLELGNNWEFFVSPFAHSSLNYRENRKEFMLQLGETNVLKRSTAVRLE